MAAAKDSMPVETILDVLRTTVRRLTGLTAGVPRELLHAAPAGTWSVNDVLAHLRACDDILGGAMLRIVREDEPRWKAVHPRTWLTQTDYPAWPFDRSFEAFARQRAHLLATLEPLAEASWERTARVAGLRGGPSEPTARFYGDWLARHERRHVDDLPRVLAAARAVGPGAASEAEPGTRGTVRA